MAASTTRTPFERTSASARSGVRRATPGDAQRIRNRRFYLYSYEPDTGWGAHAPALTVDFSDGAFYVDDVRVVRPRVTADYVSWYQQAEDARGRHFTAGSLSLHSNGYEAHGTLAVGTSYADAVPHAVLATAIPTVDYITRISTSTHPAGTAPRHGTCQRLGGGPPLVHRLPAASRPERACARGHLGRAGHHAAVHL